MKGESFQKLFAAGNSYWLTRFVILRLLGFVYAVAFLVAAQQLVPLIGGHGLTPANHFLESVQTQLGSRTAGMLRVPTLFWFGISDDALSIFAWIGLGLSLVVLGGYANAILLGVLWAMYMSIVHVGQIWYGYGWEIQLLETGFLSIFLCPLIDGRAFPKCRPPILVIWLFRWLGFRIMIGAGLIKLRGDPCWRDLTCLYYHYETQPIPSPISRYLHFAPHWFHKFETAWNHFVELIVLWFPCVPLDRVNTYGAFGSVGRERDEIIFEGTEDSVITGDTKWKEYEFKAKPGDPNRRPPFVAPYQPRIDWQIWFAAMASPEEYPWTLHFVWKLLHNDPGTLSLLANNPFPNAPPHYIRAPLYRYRFAPIGEKEWWKR